MMGSIYTSLSGLLSFSKGLDVISDNVANMNTAGFKAKSVQFENLFYEYQTSSQNNGNQANFEAGSGVKASSTVTRFTQGELRQTGTDSDVGINGNGYFVLRENNEIFYSRAGQFDFDNEGYLVDRQSGIRVAGLKNGQLEDINLQSLRSNSPKATSRIEFRDNLSTGSSEHEVSDVRVFDSSGEQQTLRIKFTNNQDVTPRSWLVEVFDDNDASITTAEIRFQGNGSPDADYKQHTFAYTPSNGANFNITLSFGEPDSFSGATSFSGGETSTLQVGEIEGYGVGSITSTTFDSNGNLTLEYSNGQKEVPFQLALAHFESQQELQSIGGSLLVNNSGQKALYGTGGEGVMGAVVGGSVELSNVELSQEFTDLVIVQRGYQASSQILTVSNEMIQQLLDSRGQR